MVSYACALMSRHEMIAAKGPATRLAGFERNVTKDEPPKFNPTKNLFRIGFALGLGIEIKLNTDKCKEIVNSNPTP